MSMTDPIADMLTRIRNANADRKKSVTMPSTKVKLSIAEVLKREGYISEFELIEKPLQNELKIVLKYGPEGEMVIQKVERCSKPGRRIYRSADALPEVRDGLGIAVVSTSRGMMSDRECRKNKLGGEVLCTIY